MLANMKLVISLLLFYCVLFFSCNDKAKECNYNERAIQLNDSAIMISSWGDTAKILIAIELLNEATDIQPDYYLAYWNKLTFQRQLNLMDDASVTLKVMEQLSPENPDLKTMLGAIYERYRKDTVLAINKYNEADLLYKTILDTLNPASFSYQSVVTSYAFNLKMLRKNIDFDSIFIYGYYNNDKEKYETFKKYIENHFVRKSREELINMYSVDFDHYNDSNFEFE
jgi:hypothetical protein